MSNLRDILLTKFKLLFTNKIKLYTFGGLVALSTIAFSSNNLSNEDEEQSLADDSVNINEIFLQRSLDCRAQTSPLDRLDCYDNAWLDKKEIDAVSETSTSDIWLKAKEIESTRDPNNSNFIVHKDSNSDDLDVYITLPSLGSKPDNPIFMLSCKDNITRMQIILMQPIEGNDVGIDVKIDERKKSFKWFIRENGFVIESSRGLEGISEITTFFGADKITMYSPEGLFSPFTFKIKNLSQIIAPLRETCHW